MNLSEDDIEFLNYVENQLKYGDGMFTFETVDRLYIMAGIFHRYDEKFVKCSMHELEIKALVLKAKMLATDNIMELEKLMKMQRKPDITLKLLTEANK